MKYALFENDKLVGLFARPQPHLGNLITVPDRPGENYIWENGEWVLDKTDFVRRVKEEANKRIIAATGGGEYWREKQANYQARFTELKFKSLEAPLSEKEIKELKFIETLWDTIKEIRAFSNQLEKELPNSDIQNANWPV